MAIPINPTHRNRDVYRYQRLMSQHYLLLGGAYAKQGNLYSWKGTNWLFFTGNDTEDRRMRRLMCRYRLAKGLRRRQVVELKHFHRWLLDDMPIMRNHRLRSVSETGEQFDLGRWPRENSLKRSDSFEQLLPDGSAKDKHHLPATNSALHSYVGHSSINRSNVFHMLELPSAALGGGDYRVKPRMVVDMFYRVWAHALVLLSMGHYDKDPTRILELPFPKPDQPPQITEWQQHICSLIALNLDRDPDELWNECTYNMCQLYHAEEFRVFVHPTVNATQGFRTSDNYRNSLPALPKIQYPNPFPLVAPQPVSQLCLTCHQVLPPGAPPAAASQFVPIDVDELNSTTASSNSTSLSQETVQHKPTPVDVESLNDDERMLSFDAEDEPGRVITPAEEKELLETSDEQMENEAFMDCAESPIDLK